MSKDIKTTIKCKNLAPIVNLDKEIMSSSLKFAIYANNGEGKTFISNMFRLTENKKGDILNDNKLLTDKFISFGKSSSEFSFKISENQKIMEDFKIEINKGSMPNIPPTKYIYHVFNQLYIDENSKVNYDKDGNITDYIIGKGNIDISEEKGLLEEKTEEKSKLEIETKTTLSAAIEQKIGNIQNIKRLNEFKEYLNYNKISDSSIITFKGIDKSFKEYIIDYDKIKSVPENLAIINEIPRIELDTELFISIREELQVQFNLSKVADEFKEKILQKKSFIEQGLKLLNKKDICPFCEQDLKSNELKLIDEYTAFLNDEENKTIKKFENRKKQIIDLSQLVENTINFNLKIWKTYSNYIENYFASSKDHNLTEFYVKNLRDNLITIEKKIDDKIINIHNSIGLGIDFFQRITDDIKSYNKVIENNNNKILLLNNKLNNLTKENQNIRRNLCKALFNELTIEYKPIIQSIKTLDLEIGKIAKDIKKKQELNKINRKEKVAETVSSILKFFFKDKYTLDKETFRLIFKSMKLEEGQASNILSEGEKSIIAFAYYMGDTHLKVNTVDDYDKIFFIIDDPISSMDFNHVYALSSIIRDLKVVLNFEKKVRLIIFTHNLEFMRIIVANNIVSNNFLLHEGEIKKFNNTLSVPYISHLVDIFKISDSKRDPDHTTPNSIRHILETITKFESLELGKDSIKIYLEKYFKDDIKIYPLINDLSHGAWRNEQDTITDTEYVLLCKAVIDHINVKYQNQIDYCRKLCNS